MLKIGLWKYRDSSCAGYDAVAGFVNSAMKLRDILYSKCYAMERILVETIMQATVEEFPFLCNGSINTPLQQ
jgi:hypothetical protein